MNGKFISREEALKRLQMTSEQLDALVSEGELRSFRDGATIRFKTEDIENLKKRSETEATIVLGGGKKGAESSDDETSEVDLDSIEVESEADESDQTSILPLDVPGGKEEGAVLDLDEAGGGKESEGTSLAAVLDESPTVERPKKRGEDSDFTSTVLDEKAAETDHGIDLAEVNKGGAGASDTDVASSLLEIVEEEKKKKGVTGLLMAAEKETTGKPSVTAETVGLEPASASELGTVAIEPVEAAGGVEETVPMEAAEEALAEPGAPTAAAEAGPPVEGGLGLEDYLREVEPEGAAVKFGLLLTAIILIYSTVLVYNLHAGVNNGLTSWLTDLVKRFMQ